MVVPSRPSTPPTTSPRDVRVETDGVVALPTSAFAPVGPARLLDTRALGPRPTAGTTLAVPVRGIAGVHPDAVAVSANLTATDSGGAGYVTAWGDGERPGTSTINLDAAGQTRTNFAIVPIGADGSVRLFTQGDVHLVLDVTGEFRPTTSATAGRLVPLGPARLLDTRDAPQPLAAHETRRVDTTPLGVPADATAVALVVTGIAPDAWFAAWPDGEPWNGTSTVHTGPSGAPVSAAAIVPVRQGVLQITGSRGGDVVLDVTGWFTGPDAPASTDGLFVPVTPTRLADTRGSHGTSPPVDERGTLLVRSFPFDIASAGAVALDVTSVRPQTDGYLSAFATAPAHRLDTSVANVEAGEILAAGAIVPTSASGVSVFTQARSHLVVDVTGWFTIAARSLAPLPVPVPGAGGTFVPTVTHPDGRPARWDACSIPVIVDFSDAQLRARGVLDAAVDDLRAATGFDLRVLEAGVTGAPVDGAITVEWAAGGAIAGLGGDVVGLGGFGYTDQAIVWGQVVVRDDVPLGIGSDGVDLLRFVLAHELAHAIGLGHVGDRAQVMYPYAAGHDHYQAGDLAGLATLGRAADCG
ncbi:MAG: matrixin family metalloprotease [Acidimicrobiales bacterium]